MKKPNEFEIWVKEEKHHFVCYKVDGVDKLWEEWNKKVDVDAIEHPEMEFAEWIYDNNEDDYLDWNGDGDIVLLDAEVWDYEVNGGND